MFRTRAVRVPWWLVLLTLLVGAVAIAGLVTGSISLGKLNHLKKATTGEQGPPGDVGSPGPHPSNGPVGPPGSNAPNPSNGAPGVPGSNAPFPSSGPVGPPGSNAPFPSNGPVGPPGSNAPLPSNGPVGPPGSNAPIPSASPSPSPLPSGCDFFKPSICSDEIITDTVNTISTCSQVYDHTEDGVILPDWSIQTLQGAGEPVVVPPSSFPLDEFPLNALPVGSLPPGTPVMVANGLTITPGTGLVSIIDDGFGEHIIQLGQPEPSWSSGSSADHAPPGNGGVVRVTITVDQSGLPSGAAALGFEVIGEWSSEFGYDFLTLSGAVGLSGSGFGTPAHPYENATQTGTLLPGLSLSAVYSKDSNFLQGFDNAHLRIRNVQPVGLPTPPPLGPPGLVMSLPNSLEDYVCREISLCSNDANVHVVSMSGTGLSFDLEGKYTQMLFVGGGPCCVKMTASSPTRMSVQTPQSSCAQFCRDDGQACVTSFGKLSDAFVPIDIAQTGILPSTHQNIVLTADGPTTHVIPCDNIDQYVGHNYIVTNAAGQNRYLYILAGDSPCGAHFQVGDPLAGGNTSDDIERSRYKWH